ncbi:dynein heavy chain, partial [Kipferlia bialata]
WDQKSGLIKDSVLKELYPPMPPMFLKAIMIDKAETRDMYECPMYMTKRRGPTYVWPFHLKTRDPATKWILAGVALVMACD